MPPQTTYDFPPFRLHSDEQLLTANGRPLKLGSRALNLLLALVERRDRIVSKNELLEIVWPKLVVEENNLQVQVTSLRKVLGPAAIATIPGRGYRFALPVQAGVPERSPAELLHHSAAPPDGPKAATIAAAESLPPSNLPVQSGTLYGREGDVGALSSLLTTCKLVTIVGAGGIGKTRVGQAVAYATRGEFVDGVCWVELAAIADASFVPAAVARALTITLGDDRAAMQAVVTGIEKKRLLLVLDNCEHLLDGVCALVDAVIAGAPNVTLLVTSQEVLKMSAEHVYRLGSLGLAHATDVATVATSGACALLCARIRGAMPRFELTRDNVAAVAEICRQLDGIPLAIELAAARVPLLGVEGVRARLNERFRVLTAGARVVLRRHQTLRAALEWSHGLLSNAESAVFRRLGVFAGGFTLESAQRVADDDHIDIWDVLEQLGALVDKSLVLAEGEPIPRYRMLETTRLFALEQLAQAGETDMVTRKHAEAIAALLGTIHSPAHRWRTIAADQAAAAVELDNVRAALEWAQQLPRLDVTALDLAGVSSSAFYSAYSSGEGFRRLLSVAPRVDQELPAHSRARFWLSLANLGTQMARIESFDAAMNAAGLFEELSDDQQRYAALACAIGISARCDTGADIEALIADAVRLERAEWPPGLLSRLQWVRHRWLLRQGRPDLAIAYASRQAELAAAGGSPKSSYVIESANVAQCELAMGRADAAERRARRALDAIGSDLGFGHGLDNLAMAIACQGRFDEAMAVARRAYAELKASGDEFMLLDGVAMIAAEQGRLHDAALTAGHADANLADRKFVRWPLSEKWRTRTEQLLEALPASEVNQLRVRGATLPTQRAFEHAFGDARPDA